MLSIRAVVDCWMTSFVPNGMDVDTSPTMSHLPQPGLATHVPTLGGRQHVGYVYSEEMLYHAASTEQDEDQHPEHPHRITRIYAALLNAGYIGMMKELPIRPCIAEEVLLVHSEDLWEKVIAIKCKVEQ